MRLKRRSFLKISGLAGFHSVLVQPLPMTALAAFDTSDLLFRNFVTPPETARASCYWWWFNGLVDEEGIRRDLEAFKARGMGGVLLVNSSDGLGGTRTRAFAITQVRRCIANSFLLRMLSQPDLYSLSWELSKIFVGYG